MPRRAQLPQNAALVGMLLALRFSPTCAFNLQAGSSARPFLLKSQTLSSASLTSCWKGRFALRKFSANPRRSGRSRMLMSEGVDPLSSLKALEERLEVVVAAEDYQEAAEIRDKINEFRQDTYIAVLQANSEFYRAFRERSLDAMKSIWHDPGEGGDKMVVCCHPGTGPIVGRDKVVASWKAILGEGAPSLTPDNVQISILGDVAWVTCEETFGGEAGLQAPEISMLATNIFVRGNGGWKMTHHHAGPIQGRVEFLVGD